MACSAINRSPESGIRQEFAPPFGSLGLSDGIGMESRRPPLTAKSGAIQSFAWEHFSSRRYFWYFVDDFSM